MGVVLHVYVWVCLCMCFVCDPSHVCVPRCAADGFDKVFPMERLSMFTPHELRLLLCGEQAPSWTREDILNYTEPKHGYNRDR